MPDQAYRIKPVVFCGSERTILLQSENGPCPLLALANVLLLQNQLKISSDQGTISFEELVQRVGNLLLDVNTPSRRSGEEAANIQMHINEVISILPRLNVGLDVNVQFREPAAFEPTPELAVFDMFGVEMFHGWTVAEDEAARPLLEGLSYNQLVERVIAYEELKQKILDGSDDVPADSDRLCAEGDALQSWMNANASQLTYDGIVRVHHAVKENQLIVFFRNNHFSTLFKRNGQLLLLATDEGFAERPRIMWERLDDIGGDTSAYLGPDFEPATEADELNAVTAQYTSTANGVTAEMTEQEIIDHQLARQLQIEEANGRPAQQQARGAGGRGAPMGRPVPANAQVTHSYPTGMANQPTPNRRRKNKNCSIM